MCNTNEIYWVICTADGYEPTKFWDYATARDYYNHLKQKGLDVEFIEPSE